MTNQTQFPFETTKARLLLQVVQDGILGYSVNHHLDGMKRSFRVATKDEDFELCILPPGDWQLLGTGDLNEVTEEQAESVVEMYPVVKNERRFYKNYGKQVICKEVPWMDTACESIASLARCLGIPEDKKTIGLFTLK